MTLAQPHIQSLDLKNILSFGPDSAPIELGPLNVLIGPNGSGKSNLLEVLSLLKAAPRDLSEPIREGGGVADWLWKGTSSGGLAEIEVSVADAEMAESGFCHGFSFLGQKTEIELKTEHIGPVYYDESLSPHPFLYSMDEHQAIIHEDGLQIDIGANRLSAEHSVLSQMRDPNRFPYLSFLTHFYTGIRLYREWSMGRYTPARSPQKADLPNRQLTETCDNLALVLNSFRFKDGAYSDFMEALKTLYPGIKDIEVDIEGGSVQLFLREDKFLIPATRLSDGTLRYLCLLSILCNPSPPPVVCIEEPELGLHPDVMSSLADLMIKASKRCQLIVTTHSDSLIDALTETPESIMICEKHDGQTQMKRLDGDSLKGWLEEYRLGQLWMKGEIGGVRW